jgi:hypothetical protein
MKTRCNPKYKETYPYHAGKNIKISPQFKRFEDFMEWSLNNGYEHGLTIDRIDPDKDYGPENCRFVDRNTQTWNQGKRKSNRKYIGVQKVTWDRIKKDLWRAIITSNKKRYYLGCFESEEEAARAFDRKCIELRGKEAKTNFPREDYE